MKDIIEYDPKILIALGEAIDRNEKIHRWLLGNGYPEFAALASSLQADVNAFDWLLKNGYNHFAAFSNAIDEDNDALKWLVKHKFTYLAMIVDAAYFRVPALRFLKDKKLDIFIRLAMKIRTLKEAQHLDYSFYYKIHF